jgi:hypothetical protein
MTKYLVTHEYIDEKFSIVALIRKLNVPSMNSYVPFVSVNERGPFTAIGYENNMSNNSSRWLFNCKLSSETC